MGALTTYPIDTVKTRVQAGLFPTTIRCVTATFQKEGIRGFYRGFSTPFVSQPLYMGAAFGGMALGRHLYDTYIDAGGGAGRLLFAGAISGLCCSSVVTPFERVKILLQASTGGRQSSVAQVLRDTLREGKPSLFFRGWRACAAREVPGCVIWFGAYDQGYAALLDAGYSRSTSVLGGGLTAAVAFWVTCMPQERIKTMQQSSLSSNDSALQIFKRVLRTQGIPGLFVGLSVVLTRGILIDLVQFSAADKLRVQLQSME